MFGMVETYFPSQSHPCGLSGIYTVMYTDIHTAAAQHRYKIKKPVHLLKFTKTLQLQCRNLKFSGKNSRTPLQRLGRGSSYLLLIPNLASPSMGTFEEF